MFESIVVIIFGLLMGITIRTAISVAWGLAKVIAVLLCVVALAGLFIGLAYAAGALLLVPVGLIAGAWGLLAACGR